MPERQSASRDRILRKRPRRGIPDDRVLGEFPFFRHPPGGWGTDLASSTAELVELEDIWATGATHEVIVRVTNPLDEVLAANAPVEVVIKEGGEVMDVSLASDGTWVTAVKAKPGKVMLEIDVFVEGSFLTSFSQESNTPIPPGYEEEDAGREEADISEETRPEDGPAPPEEEEPAAPREDSGCGAGAAPTQLPWLWALAFLVVLGSRRGRASGTCDAWPPLAMVGSILNSRRRGRR